MSDRHPMTPAEFDSAMRRLIARHPGLSETSGYRSAVRNAIKGGKAGSKHRLGMARDVVAISTDILATAALTAVELGLWIEHEDIGQPNEHLHVQGLPPGEPPGWWLMKYGVERAA